MNTSKISYWFPLAIVFFEIATYLANDMYLPGLPVLMADLQISKEVAQNTLLYWFLGTASMQLLMGPLSDTYGRKIILLLGAISFTLTSFICALTDHIALFLLARFIQGCAVCAVVVAGYSAVHEFYESKTAIKITATMGSIVILAPAFGPVFGALVIEISHWRTIFYILGLWGTLSVISLLKAVPTTQTEKINLDLKVIAKDYVNIASRKSFLVFTLPFCMLFLALICWVVETPFLLIEHYQKSVIEFGLIQLCVFGFFMLGAQITGRLVHKYEPLQLIKVGLSLALVAAIALAMSSFFQLPLYLLVGLTMISTLGSAMTFGPLSRLAVEACQEPMGRRMAIFSSYMSFFGVFATGLISLFKEMTMQHLTSIMLLGIFLATAIFFGLEKPQLVLQEEDESTPPIL